MLIMLYSTLEPLQFIFIVLEAQCSKLAKILQVRLHQCYDTPVMHLCTKWTFFFFFLQHHRIVTYILLHSVCDPL